MENAVNTMTITLNEYKSMIDEVNNLKRELENQRDVVTQRNCEIAHLNTEIGKLENDVSEANTYVYLTNAENPSGILYNNFVRLSKDSPELVKIIENSINKEQAKIVKSQKEEIDNLKDKITALEKRNKKYHNDIVDDYEYQIKELHKELNNVKEDYENLKLDKAANIVEAERLAEINKLNEQIAYLEVIKDGEKIVWPRGFFTKLFRKQILKAAEDLYSQFTARKEFKRINTTSAIGKGRDYLKTLENNNVKFSYAF